MTKTNTEWLHDNTFTFTLASRKSRSTSPEGISFVRLRAPCDRLSTTDRPLFGRSRSPLNPHSSQYNVRDLSNNGFSDFQALGHVPPFINCSATAFTRYRQYLSQPPAEIIRSHAIPGDWAIINSSRCPSHGVAHAAANCHRIASIYNWPKQFFLID